MTEMYTENFAFLLFRVLQLFAHGFAIVLKSNLLTNRLTNFPICITVSFHSSENLKKHILQNKSSLPAAVNLFKVIS